MVKGTLQLVSIVTMTSSGISEGKGGQCWLVDGAQKNSLMRGK
jgi:hypothetical protein